MHRYSTVLKISEKGVTTSYKLSSCWALYSIIAIQYPKAYSIISVINILKQYSTILLILLCSHLY